ncbi:glycosyltransferase family 2 protein [Paracidovorax citrulli]|uniref:glycosyltransferase family 2 protein n=1 Tax=Paracidovorax citrulli TaxID=80869 RepID=UPI0006982C33|nr:glycosyltransferase [Paracidovorax citrulli]
MSAAPDFSLVVATIDPDGALLRALLDSLADSTERSFEVIVADQTQGDHLARVVDDFAGRLCVHRLSLPTRGASAARNAGAARARGRWVGFPDDDCRYQPGTLSVARRVLSMEGVRIATGRTVTAAQQPSVLRWHATAKDFDRWSMFACLTEATLFAERSLFLSVGGFDSRFGPGAPFTAAEGVELVDRLLREGSGWRARFDPAIQVEHPDKIPPWNRWAMQRFYRYAQGDGAFVVHRLGGHTLRWVILTLGSAGLRTLVFRGWVSVAHGARIAGICVGAWRYAWAARKGSGR